jgi:hypothetical protein
MKTATIMKNKVNDFMRSRNMEEVTAKIDIFSIWEWIDSSYLYS